MSEILPRESYTEPPKTEKINGIIYNMAGGSFKHADTISALNSLLHAHFRGKSCKVYSSELDIHLDDNNMFRPDISIICDFSKMRDDGYYGAPTMVIEVLSPSTAKRDRGDKFDCYQAHGVEELWLVNPEYETIEQYTRDNSNFKPPSIHFKSGTSFTSTAFEGLDIKIDDVFPVGSR